jgi:hypothetical protein
MDSTIGADSAGNWLLVGRRAEDCRRRSRPCPHLDDLHMSQLSQSNLSKKLLIKPGQTVTVLNAPAGFEQMLQPLPTGAKLSHQLQSELGAVVLFVRNVSELQQWGTKVTKAMAHDGLLWIAYPKQSSKVKSDLNRDTGWGVIVRAGCGCVAQIAIDETWSGSRFRRVEFIGTSRKLETSK